MHDGFEIVRVAGIPWEDRINVDHWPSRAGTYCDDRDNALCIRLIDYPVGSTEPRHVHGGTHATTVLKGSVLVDGLTLGPLDVIIGPSNEPHGPLHYPQGCQLLSAFQGSYYHSEVAQLSGRNTYRLVQQERLPWTGSQPAVKTLVDDGCGRLLVEAVRFEPGSRLLAGARPGLHSALVVEGEAVVGDQTLGPWDFLRVPRGRSHGPVEFPRGATLLALTLR